MVKRDRPLAIERSPLFKVLIVRSPPLGLAPDLHPWDTAEWFNLSFCAAASASTAFDVI